MKTKNTWTLQKWRLLKKRPTLDRCHHWGPNAANTTPLSTTQTSAAMGTTPKTKTEAPTKRRGGGGGRPTCGPLLAAAAFHSFFSFSGDELCPGNGRISASAKKTTMSPIKIRFGQEMRMKPQCK